MNATEPSAVLRDGALVVLEGLDSAGKSTQAEALIERLGRLGSAPNRLHMPSGDSNVTKAVYEAMEDGGLKSPFARQLLHLACHTENASKIAELRENGGLLLDRWWWSTHSYGVCSADLSDRERRALKEVIDVVWGGVAADVVFLFLHPFSADRHNVAGIEAAYRELADRHPDVAVVVAQGDVKDRSEFMLGELAGRGLLA